MLISCFVHLRIGMDDKADLWVQPQANVFRLHPVSLHVQNPSRQRGLHAALLYCSSANSGTERMKARPSDVHLGYGWKSKVARYGMRCRV
jgi:hypothetical protein